MRPPTCKRPHALLVLALLSTGATIAQANLTPVRPPFGTEATHSSIFSNYYGGVFAPGPNGAPSYTNGAITATRVDDTIGKTGIGNNLNLVSGAPDSATTDQRWEDGIAITAAVARFAGYTQEFGYDEGNGYVKLFDVAVNGSGGYNVSGSGSYHFTEGVPWNWVRGGTGQRYYSENGRNSDGLDHMITYQITGLRSSDTVWMLFWEDRPGAFRSAGSDRDFNDLVVEIRASVANIVPVPGAALLGGLGMAIIGLARGRRKFGN